MARAVSLCKVGRVERLVIGLLREAGVVAHARAILARSVGISARDYGTIQDLVTQARAGGLEIFSAAAPFVSEGERLLLGWMAYAQRDRIDDILRLSATWRAAVRPCARLLTAHDLFIAYRSALEAAVLSADLASDDDRR